MKDLKIDYEKLVTDPSFVAWAKEWVRRAARNEKWGNMTVEEQLEEIDRIAHDKIDMEYAISVNK